MVGLLNSVQLVAKSTKCITNMKQKSVVQSIRFSSIQIEKMAWLKSKKIRPSVLIRNGFDKEFKKYKKEYDKTQDKFVPF